MFDFCDEDFEKVIDHPVYNAGISLLIQNTIIPLKNYHDFYRGDAKLFEELEKLDPIEYWVHLNSQNISLPYMSFCEDPEKYVKLYGPEHTSTGYIKSDLVLRNQLISKATYKTSPYWWCMVHSCGEVAVFLLYPMFRILYPKSKIYLYAGPGHIVLIISPDLEKEEIVKVLRDGTDKKGRDGTLMVDLIGWCMDANIGYDGECWIFEPTHDGLLDINRFVESGDIITWYCKNYGWDNMDYTPFTTFDKMVKEL
jgi:hypothetical protein